ncbi:MAG: peptide ABC transporter substrate-binding protein [Chloroflexi bacterium]|nr:peptide ABC transporter substrate-binding protein [Chloroflexota bacterium]
MTVCKGKGQRGAMPWSATCLIGLALAIVGCAPTNGTGGGAQQPSPSAPSRTLVMMTQIDPLLAPSPLASGTSTGRGSLADVLFTAGLSHDDQARDNTAVTVWPQLAETLPQLDTDSWRVFPDGRMETTWVLRPGLTWHDGAPLTGDDVVFGWQVRNTPEYVPAGDLQLIDEVVAKDSRTVVVRWKAPYFAAGAGGSVGSPMPRHVLGEAFAQQTPQQFASHPYFGVTNYVGAGPYRLERWEPGSFLEGSAFDGYTLGRPSIDRIRLAIVSDKNTALANMLAGEVQMSFDAALFIEQGGILKQQWGKSNGGTVSLEADQIRFVAFQLKKEFVNPTQILDVRVRQALAVAIDKRGFIDGLLGGDGYVAETLMAPYVPFYAQIERVAQKYPYDLQRAAQLLADVGFSKGADGSYRLPSGEPFSLTLMASSGYDRERAILADMWRKAGIDIKEQDVSVTQDADRQFRAAFPAAYGTSQNLGLPGALGRLNGRTIATPENRFSGNNYFGYSNPEFDRLLDVTATSLRQDERVAATIEAVRIASIDLPFVPMYLNPRSASAFSSSLQAPTTSPASKPGWWNIEAWKWKS